MKSHYLFVALAVSACGSDSMSTRHEVRASGSVSAEGKVVAEIKTDIKETCRRFRSEEKELECIKALAEMYRDMGALPDSVKVEGEISNAD